MLSGLGKEHGPVGKKMLRVESDLLNYFDFFLLLFSLAAVKNGKNEFHHQIAHRLTGHYLL